MTELGKNIRETHEAIVLAHAPVDIRVQDEGTILLFWPISDAGAEWINDHLDPEGLRWGGARVVEHRYAQDIIDGAREDGLVFGRF